MAGEEGLPQRPLEQQNPLQSLRVVLQTPADSITTFTQLTNAASFVADDVQQLLTNLGYDLSSPLKKQGDGYDLEVEIEKDHGLYLYRTARDHTKYPYDLTLRIPFEENFAIAKNPSQNMTNIFAVEQYPHTGVTHEDRYSRVSQDPAALPDNDVTQKQFFSCLQSGLTSLLETFSTPAPSKK